MRDARERDSDLAVALALADQADAVTLARFGAVDLQVDTKPDLTPVSDADHAVETGLRETLARTRPDDSVLGEEFGGSTTLTGRQWIIDPIDGTKNFVRGVPVWASLIALLIDGVPQVGVVSAPALHRRWWASSGVGAFVAVGFFSVTTRFGQPVVFQPVRVGPARRARSLPGPHR
jgi:histidinol-phosphatase